MADVPAQGQEPVKPSPDQVRGEAPAPNTALPPPVTDGLTDAPATVREGPEPGAAPSEPPAQPASETPAEPAEAAPEPNPTDVPEAKPSLLSEAAAAEPPAEQPKEAEPPAEVPHYEPFTLPDGFQVSEERMAPFVGFLSEAKLSQEQGQALMDMHAAEVQRAIERAGELQWQVHNTMREGWRDEFEKDPDLGGNRRQTTLNSAIGFVRHYASDAEHLKRALQVLDFTGAGDHPDIIRLLANAAKGMAQQYREGAPVRAEQPAPQEQSRYRRRYQATSANGSAR